MTWTPRTRNRAALAAAALLALALLSALVAPSTTRSFLDPDAATPGGARAVAEVLRAQGVTVERTTDAARARSAGPGTTLVVAYPVLLDADAVAELESSTADVVLLGPPAQSPSYLGVEAAETVDVRLRQPVCALQAADAAGAALTGAVSFEVTERAVAAETCYPAATGATVVQVSSRTGARHTLLGSAEFLTNDRVDEDGNAALALNLLGGQPRLVWWLPTREFTGTRPLTSLLPDALWPVLTALVVLVLVTAAWRGRRLGQVVVEPLPVAVRASETTEGRARLYQRYRSRDQAARHLRGHAEATLMRRLSVSRTAPPELVVDAVSSATGRPPRDIQDLLYGPAPQGDDALVTLAQELSTLEQEAGRP